MKFSKFASSVAFALTASLASASTIAADVTVRLVDVDRNLEVSVFYNNSPQPVSGRQELLETSVNQAVFG